MKAGRNERTEEGRERKKEMRPGKSERMVGICFFRSDLLTATAMRLSAPSLHHLCHQDTF